MYIFSTYSPTKSSLTTGDIPSEVVIEDKTAVEQLMLIQQLEEEDRQTIFNLIDKMFTYKKFKDFFKKNVAAL